MTELERLREEYRNWWSATEGWTRPEGAQKADALIAALGDEIAELTGQNIDLEVWRASAVKRAEQAEAELAAMTKERDNLRSLLEVTEDARSDWREEARMWEWCLDYILNNARAVDLYYDVPEARIGDVDDVKRCLLARYQPAGEDV